ncbi:MAG TPA: hypothetical protein VI894_00310 [Candidatus Nanoarchaeia archaeon]|nr:hypothetical protein [Candidatus Nanoarchaeia archaeon]
MPKKCIVCGESASFGIKDSSDYYCEECAHENFADVELLEKVEQQAQKLKEIIKEKINDRENFQG